LKSEDIGEHTYTYVGNYVNLDEIGLEKFEA
jgi:hypothetical protein